ncbi:MAG TPA: translocation/assembly module TamB domain-containing protein [Vicinamibacterales bacterium]|nr:translocation/assembly module TamB domain-containing protein [Vicinamibacterales bacterium]
MRRVSVARFAGRLARLAGVLASLILVGIVLLHVPWVRGRVLEYVRTYVDREFGVALRASALRYNLFTRSIELRDVGIASFSAADSFLEADRLVVVLDPGVFLGRFAGSRISLGRPRLRLVRYPDGSLNLPPSRGGVERDAPLQLGVVSATGLTATLDDRAAQRSLTVGPLDLSVNVGGPPSAPGTLGPGGFTVRAGRFQTSGTIAARLAFDGTRLRVEELTVETEAGRAVLTGWADIAGERSAVDARVSATIDLPQAARLAGIDAGGLAGHVDATATATGALTAPAIAVDITSRGAEFEPVGPLRLAGRSTFRANRVLIDNVALASAAGSLQLQGAVELGGSPADAGHPVSRVSLEWTAVRIDDLAPALNPSLPVRFGSVARGSGTVEFDVRDPQARAPLRLRATATTELEPEAQATTGDSLGLAGTAHLQVRDGRWSVRHSLHAERAQVELAGDVAGRFLDSPRGVHSTVGGRSRVHAADIGVLQPLLQAAGVTLPPEVADGLAGSVLATVDLAGTVERPFARIDLEGRDLRAGLWPHAAAIDARVAVDANGVRVDPLQATAGTTSLRASGRYAWRGPFEATIELTDDDLTAISSRFNLPATVGGSARLEGTISGVISKARRAGTAELSLSSKDLSIDQVSAGPLSARGTIPLADGGVITVDAVAPGIGARAQLQIVNRIGYPVSGEIALDHDEIGALIPPRYREQMAEVSGRLSATARFSGQLSDPAGIRGRLDLSGLDLTLRGTRVALAAPGSVTLSGDRIHVDSLDLHVGARTRATLTGQLGRAVLPDPLRLRVDGPLSELITIGARTAGTEPLAIRGDGAVVLDLRVEGTLGHPLPAGTVSVRSSSLAYATLAPVTGLAVDATVDPTVITLRSVAAQWQGASLRGAGTLPWRVVLHSLEASSQGVAREPSRFEEWLKALPAEPAQAGLTLRADNVTEGVLKDVVAPGQFGDVRAQASATVAVEADRLTLDRVRATAVIDPARLTLAGVPFTQTVPTRLRLENGRASIAAFHWVAEGNSVVATGGADLAGVQPSLDVGIAAALDLRVLGAFVGGIASGGTAQAELQLTGPFGSPRVAGRIAVADGELQVERPRLAASDLEGTLQVAADGKATVSMAGLVNAGTATLEGTLDLANLAAPQGTLHATARRVALEYPSGLQTESDVDLELALDPATPTLTGRIAVLGGTYTEPLVLTTQLLSLSGTDGIARAAPSADWMSAMRLDVTVATVDDVRIDNNYGRFDLGATLRLVGTAANPGVLGRVQAGEDGEIYLGGNTYRIERLSIDLTNPRTITPEIDFAAQTRVGDLPIGVELRCPAAGACEREVTSLATGVDDAEAEARLFGTAGGVATAGAGLARLLSGEILGVVGRTVGLDAIRLEQEAERRDIFDDPTLISGDVDPATRLTLAKRLGPDVELVYSQNLADDGFAWSTTYLGPFGLSWRLLWLDDQSRSYEFRHEIGGRGRRPVRAPGPRIDAVRIAGTPGFSEDQLRRQLRLTEGDRFTFGAWQRDRDRLARFYHGEGYLEARIRARRMGAHRGNPDPNDASTSPGQSVALEYTIARGSATHLVVRGTTLPDGVRNRIVERWTSALFDGFLERDARTIVRDYLYRDGYLNATVSAAIEHDETADAKTLTIDVVPDSKIATRIDMTGNVAVPTDQLVGIVSQADPLSPWLDPGSVERLLENHYRSEGFLAAAVSVGRPAVSDGVSAVPIHVSEGAPYAIGHVELSGLPDLPDPENRDAFALSSGDRYRPAGVAAAVERIESRLRRSAYRQATAEVETHVDADAARVDIAVRVTPGPRAILHDVVVDGADAGKPYLARSIVLQPGAPLDPSAIRETRQRLYDLDLYRSVDIVVQPLATQPPPAPGAATEQPVVARIMLEQRPRYRFRYGLALSDEPLGPDERNRRLGFAADLENTNVFGRGASAGASVRLRGDQQVGRLTLGARRFFGLPIRSTLFLEREREQLNPDGAFPITSDITSFSGEQAYGTRSSIELRYGYGIERNHTFIRDEAADPFDLTVKIARFTAGGLVDRRDDAFEPARGWFAASTLELSTPGLGSDLRFLRNFAQYSRFDGIGRNLVLASAARLGLARTFGDEVLIPSERFYSGGATSVRGYREDDLGARSIFDDAEGGSALLVLNGEVRFPIYRWLNGVGFVDMGSVYPTVSDISLADFQIGLGAGARFDTPFGLFRLDLGIPANRRSFDPRWRVHFGLGHAF